MLKVHDKEHAYHIDYEEIDRGYVAFGRNLKGEKITRKGSGVDWLFNIDAITRTMNYEPIVTGTQSNGFAGTKASDNAGQARKEKEPVKDYILLSLWNVDPPFFQNPKSSLDDGFKPLSDGKKVDEDPSKGSECNDQDKNNNVNNTNNVNTVSLTVNAAGTNRVNSIGELPFDSDMPALEDISTFYFSNKDEDNDAVDDLNNLDTTIQVSPTLTIRIHKDHPVNQVIGDLQSAKQTRIMTKNLEEHGFVCTIHQKNHKDLQNCLFACFYYKKNPKKVIHALKDPNWIEAMQEELLQFKLQEVWTLVDLPNGKRAIGTKWVFRNKKKDERGIVIRNIERLVAQGHTQEEGIDYDEIFSYVARIEAIRLFLAYALFKNFVVYQMDVKNTFLYGKIKEEVYVCQQLGFEDPDFPNRVYKVEKAMYGLHQAPRAWYETFSTYLLDNGFQRGKMDKTLFIKRHKVKQKNNGIFICQDKYVGEILKKFRFTKVKNASTPMETQKPLLKDKDGEEVDVHMYRYLKGHSKLGLWYPKDSLFDLVAYTDSDYAGASLDRKSTTGDGKEIIITESSVRRDLRLADEDGVDCLPSSTIFENLELMRKPKIKNTQVPQPSGSTKHVADEAIYKELDDKLVMAATTASSLEAEQDSGNIDKTQSKATPNEASSLGTTSNGAPRFQDTTGDTIAQTRFENMSKLSNDSLLARASSLGTTSNGGPRFQDTTGDTIAQTRVLSLEKTKTTHALEITSLKRRVKKLKKKQRSRTHKLKRLHKVGLIARVNSSEDEDASKQGCKINDIDADEDITIVSAVGEVNAASIATTVSAPATITTKEVTLAKALIELKSLKPKLVEGSSKRVGEELTQERAKKQKVDDEKETTELKKLMEIITNEEEVEIDAISLAVKPLKIVDWKIHKEGKKRNYQIIRANGNSKMYMVFNQMLKEFDREDLYDLVVCHVKFRVLAVWMLLGFIKISHFSDFSSLHRSSSKLSRDQTSNPTSSTNPTPKGRIHRSSKQKVENSNFEEHLTPVATMMDNRTVAEMLRAPTEGCAEAIVFPPILAEQFELKHSLINMMTSEQFFGLKKDNPHDHGQPVGGSKKNPRVPSPLRMILS
uniref:Reverse transcriptase Ty1/copia-type domain-containing protein n=1 Tax=Tanacetum cinerariifolium TaxID=118510 RepID=A0A6L2P3J5_TANCI|nr:hypothetical protein [Tanacetum cinerariifolium]